MGDDDLIFRTRPKGDTTPYGGMLRRLNYQILTPQYLTLLNKQNTHLLKHQDVHMLSHYFQHQKTKLADMTFQLTLAQKNETGKLVISNVDSVGTKDNEILILNDTTYTNRLKTKQGDILNEAKTRSQTSSTPKTQDIQLSP